MLAGSFRGECKMMIGRGLVPGLDIAFGGEPMDVALLWANHVKSSCLLGSLHPLALFSLLTAFTFPHLYLVCL